MVEDIPDFSAPEYEDLLNVLAFGACIFIGAGVSKLAGYKIWNELRNKLIDYFWVNKGKLLLDDRKQFDYSTCEHLRTYEDIIEVFEYLHILDKNLFVAGIKETFYKDEKTVTKGIFEAVSKLNSNKNFFVTTNIDKGFQSYLGLTDDNISIFPNFPNSPKLINYIHGRIDVEETWIFTRTQYNRGYYLDTKPCTAFLKKIFENNSVLFLGYGLREEEIKQAIVSTKKHNLHWWLEPFSRINEDHLKFKGTVYRDNYNISLLPYNIESEGHGILSKVLESLYAALMQRRT